MQFTKDLPHPSVREWLLSQEESALFLSVVTLLEIRVGVEKSPEVRKRDELERWLVKTLPKRFANRIVPVEQHVADLAGRIIDQSRRESWGMDAIIGATAMVNNMGLATLNRKHFERLAVKLVEF